jgi:hypothetical protein
LVLPLFLFTLRQWRFAWAACTCLLFALGINFFPAYQLHYAAACVCLFLLVTVVGLQRLAALKVRGAAVGRSAARVVLFLCGLHFTLWYGLHMFENTAAAHALLPYETWDSINHNNPGRRIAVNQALARIPGDLLVFVRYQYPQHPFQDEWVYNPADIDDSRVVWARDLGSDEDKKLLDYFPKRRALLLEPDARPPLLSDYPK